MEVTINTICYLKYWVNPLALNDFERVLLSLPVKVGDLNFTSPVALEHEYDHSCTITMLLVSLMPSTSPHYSYNSVTDQITAKANVKSNKCKIITDKLSSLQSSLPIDFQYSLLLAQEKGVSNWLTAILIREHGFWLHKSTFRDALVLQYDWLPLRLPSDCSCGKSFSIEHAFTCSK